MLRDSEAAVAAAAYKQKPPRRTGEACAALWEDQISGELQYFQLPFLKYMFVFGL